MKRTFLLTVLWSFCAGFSLTGQDIAAAAKLFSEKCGICHTIGQGKLIGPDLSGVQERRSEEWLLRFIRSSQAMINSGDPDAVALFAEFNKVVMPDPMISDGEIKSILQHIAQNPGSGAAPSRSARGSTSRRSRGRRTPASPRAGGSGEAAPSALRRGSCARSSRSTARRSWRGTSFIATRGVLNPGQTCVPRRGASNRADPDARSLNWTYVQLRWPIGALGQNVIRRPGAVTGRMHLRWPGA